MSLPKLRFEEFTDDWCHKTIIDLMDVSTGDKDTQNKVEDGEFPFYVRSQIVERINTYSYDGEAVLTSGDGVGVGKNFHYVNGKFDYHQRVYCLNKFKPNIYGKYIFYYFSEKFYQRVIGLSAKNSVDSIRRSMITDMQIYFPTIKEQTKIANFLTAVDEKIAQLTQKHGLLTQYKKGVMQQIFSQELRFKDDDGQSFPEWEQSELGKLCQITTGKLDANAMVEDGKYRFYTCAKEYYRIDDYAFDTDALLISGNGANVGYIHHYTGKFNAYQRTYVLDGFAENIMFIKYYLDMYLHQRIFREAKEGNTPYIVMSTLTEMSISLPSKVEQTKIANFLSAIDDKITATQTQLQAVKQYKQGLLQQMFV